MFLKKKIVIPLQKCSTDDGEWIRSLTADIPEKRITHDQSEVDPKKIRPIQMEEFLRKYVFRRPLALVADTGDDYSECWTS